MLVCTLLHSKQIALIFAVVPDLLLDDAFLLALECFSKGMFALGFGELTETVKLLDSEVI